MIKMLLQNEIIKIISRFDVTLQEHESRTQIQISTRNFKFEPQVLYEHFSFNFG